MLFLLPIILFGLTAVALALLRLRGMRMAYIWLLLAFITLVCWTLFLVLPVPAVASVIKIPWLYSLAESGSLVFNLDSNSWGFVFLLISLVLGYFFTLPIRLELEKRTVLWIGWLLLSIIAVLAFTAGNIITLILAWTLFDLLDFAFTFFVLKSGVEGHSFTEASLPKILSVSLLIVAAVFLGSGSDQLISNSLQPIAYLLILFAALFRTGLFPMQTAKSTGDQSGISFKFLKKIALVLSGFSLLSHLPANFLNGISSSLLSIFFLVFSLVFALISLSIGPETRDAWLDSIICLALISVFSGNPRSLLGWAGVVMAAAGMQQFYSLRNSGFNFFALLGVVAVSSLPFSIGLVALNGLSANGLLVWEIICLPVYSVLLLVLIQNLLTSQKENSTVETWYLAVYLFGLFLLALSPLAIVIKNAEINARAFENWWMGLAVAILTLAALLLNSQQKALRSKLAKFSKAFNPLLDFLRFGWLNGVWKWISLVITEVFSFITQLLEGEGGVIWAIVILALLVSIIGIGRS